MKVMFTVLYLTISINGLPSPTWSCVKDPRSYSIEEMEKLVYAVANDKGVPPTVIINRILRKVRFRQRNEKDRSKIHLQQIALKELLTPKHRPPTEINEDYSVSSGRGPPSLPPTKLLPPPHQLPPPLSRPPLPTFRPMSPPPEQSGLFTGVLFSSGFNPQESQNRHLYPQAFYIPVQNLGPPPGVTIRVKSSATGATFPDVVVSLSPMMTIVEALKQAESKFGLLLGLPPTSEDDIITFSRSSVAECFVIRSFNNVATSDRDYWKIIVNDNKGEVIYDSVCLPSRNEVPVKPGTTITLLYVRT